MKTHLIAISLFLLTGMTLLNMRLKEAEARIQSLEAQVQSLTSKP